MKFKNKVTGTVVETELEVFINMYKNDTNFEEVKEIKKEKTEKTEKII